MPSFDTPEPISVTARVDAGSIRFTADDRPDTVVEVRPRDPKRDKDVRAAEQTEVSYAGGVLTVRTKQRRLVGPSGVVDVAVDLPTGSRIDLTGSWAQLLSEGRLGEVRVKASVGDVRLGTTGPLELTASHGQITVERVEGKAEITSSTGNVRAWTDASRGQGRLPAVQREPGGWPTRRRAGNRCPPPVGRSATSPRAARRPGPAGCGSASPRPSLCTGPPGLLRTHRERCALLWGLPFTSYPRTRHPPAGSAPLPAYDSTSAAALLAAKPIGVTRPSPAPEILGACSTPVG